MKACMVAYTFYDTDMRVKRYAESLVRRGDEVDVIALRRDGQSEMGVEKGVRVYRIQKRIVNEKGKLSYLSRIMAFLFRSFLVLTKNHLSKKYDLIHVHNVPDFEVFAAAVPKLAGASMILDIHDILPEFYASKFDSNGPSTLFRILMLIERISSRFSDHVIISNDLWKDKLSARSVEPAKCTALINYPDLSIFKKPANPKKDDKFVILYPGTLNWHQGLDVAVKAFSLVSNEVPQAELHVYGEGPSKPDLMRLVSDFRLEKKVFFHGFVTVEEVAQKMSCADLGVVPKRSDNFGNEAFSTKILEFMAVGVPVIASETKIDRYYFDESLIKFFRSGDERDLADAVLTMVRDDSLRNRLAANGLEFVQEHSWNVKQQIYLDLVDRLVGNHR